MKAAILTATLLAFLPFAAHAEDGYEGYDDQRYEKLVRECGKNKLESCVTAAIWTRDHLESPGDAYPFAKKACDGGNMKGCNVLGNLYLNKYSGLGMDYDTALKLYQRACNGGYENACRNYKETKAEAAERKSSEAREERLEKLQQSCAMENEAACVALQREWQR